MTAIERELQEELLHGKGPCACGKMAVADVSPVSDVKFRHEPHFECDKVDIKACCRMKCNVCGHVEKKVAAQMPEATIAESSK